MQIQDYEGYAPTFPLPQWSDKDLALLAPFATNLTGYVTVLHNLPAEVIGALCSRASRARGNLLEVLLREFFNPMLEGKSNNERALFFLTVQDLVVRSPEKLLNTSRAREFYTKWLAEYGDDSIAQMTGTHVLFTGVSQLALNFLERQRIGIEFIEQSTRYVDFGKSKRGFYPYYTPEPDLKRLGFLAKYQQTLNTLFDTYESLVPQLTAWLMDAYDGERGVAEKKAFDSLRGLLPVATVSQVASRGNAQAFEYFLSRAGNHPLGELRWIASAAHAELKKEMPSLLLRLSEEKSFHYREYLSTRENLGNRLVLDGRFKGLLAARPAEERRVKLASYDHDAEAKIIAAILSEAGGENFEVLYLGAQLMDDEERVALLDTYLSGRDERWQKVGRAFEFGTMIWEIALTIGELRDLWRHRMVTRHRQLFSTRNGFYVPQDVKDAGLEERFLEALALADQLFRKLEECDPVIAQYAVPMAHLVRFVQYQNFRSLFWEAELRSGPQGHAGYRFIAQEKYRILQNIFPNIAKHMRVDMKDYHFPRRDDAERAKLKEEKLKGAL